MKIVNCTLELPVSILLFNRSRWELTNIDETFLFHNIEASIVHNKNHVK